MNSLIADEDQFARLERGDPIEFPQCRTAAPIGVGEVSIEPPDPDSQKESIVCMITQVEGSVDKDISRVLTIERK